MGETLPSVLLSSAAPQRAFLEVWGEASGVSLRGLRAWTPFGPLGLPTFFRGAPVEVDERGDALVAVRVPRVPQPVAHARHP